MVMPVGDALMEPFWPQGLGSNRGFHTALNAIFAALWAREFSFEDGVAEARFAFRMIVCFIAHGSSLQPFENWSVDPVTRFSRKLMGMARDHIHKHHQEENDLPERIAKLPDRFFHEHHQWG